MKLRRGDWAEDPPDAPPLVPDGAMAAAAAREGCRLAFLFVVGGAAADRGGKLASSWVAPDHAFRERRDAVARVVVAALWARAGRYAAPPVEIEPAAQRISNLWGPLLTGVPRRARGPPSVIQADCECWLLFGAGQVRHPSPSHREDGVMREGCVRVLGAGQEEGEPDFGGPAGATLVRLTADFARCLPCPHEQPLLQVLSGASVPPTQPAC